MIVQSGRARPTVSAPIEGIGYKPYQPEGGCDLHTYNEKGRFTTVTLTLDEMRRIADTYLILARKAAEQTK